MSAHRTKPRGGEPRALTEQQRQFRTFLAGIEHYERLAFPTLFPNRSCGGFDDPAAGHEDFHDYANELLHLPVFRYHTGWRVFVSEMSARFNSAGFEGEIGAAPSKKRKKKKKRRKKAGQAGSNADDASRTASSSSASPTQKASLLRPALSAFGNSPPNEQVEAMAAAVKHISKSTGIDYSKWDNLVVSSSDDEDFGGGAQSSLRNDHTKPQQGQHHTGDPDCEQCRRESEKSAALAAAAAQKQKQKQKQAAPAAATAATPARRQGIDYSKWDHIDCTDSEDELDDNYDDGDFYSQGGDGFPLNAADLEPHGAVDSFADHAGSTGPVSPPDASCITPAVKQMFAKVFGGAMSDQVHAQIFTSDTTQLSDEASGKPPANPLTSGGEPTTISPTGDVGQKMYGPVPPPARSRGAAST